jgi:hypothetical protein
MMSAKRHVYITKELLLYCFSIVEFNKFTDRMLEITGIKSLIETDQQWGSAVQ